MIFKKAQQSVLIRRIGAEVKAHTLRTIVFEAVIRVFCRNNNRIPAAVAQIRDPNMPRL